MSLETLSMVLYMSLPLIITAIVALIGLIFLVRWFLKKQINLLIISIVCLISVGLFMWWAYTH
jgi:flagellar biosynthesis protein FliR